MKIQKVLNQHRRDFRAIYECEHCGYTHESHGYDDSYFHQEVVPNMVCESCGNKAPDDHEPNSPKYPEGVQL